MLIGAKVDAIYAAITWLVADRDVALGSVAADPAVARQIGNASAAGA